MQRSEIIELANQLTERKGERVLNLQTLYRLVLQDICKRERFWWRRVEFSFTLTIGTATYDLTKITPAPSTALTEIALDEITKFTLILTQNPLQVAELTPVFSPEALIEMINNTSVVNPLIGLPGQNIPGGRYTLDANDYKTLRIDPPDQAYTAYIVGWGMPNPGSDSSNDAVPLIPPWGHNTIIAGMMAKLFKYAYGSRNEKTIDAAAEYEQGIQDLQQRKKFDPNYRSQLSLAEGAVRST